MQQVAIEDQAAAAVPPWVRAHRRVVEERVDRRHPGVWTVLSGLSLYVLIGLIAFAAWLSVPQLGGSRAERVSSFLRDSASGLVARVQPVGATAATDVLMPVAGVDGRAPATFDGASSTGTQLRIANTAGRGVLVRSACRDSTPGTGVWAEGTAVRVLRTGSGECAGWSLLRSQGALSWVRTAYVAGARTSAP